MSLFTERLYKETYISHKSVDRHPFIERMMTCQKAAVLYICFNQSCISEIQKTLNLGDDDLQTLLYRNISCPLETYRSGYLINLLEACRMYPLEHAYMFYLGLLAGGNLLRKYIPVEYQCLLTSEIESKAIIIKFKHFLNSKIIDEEHQQQFINRVKASYILIAKCFDNFIQ